MGRGHRANEWAYGEEEAEAGAWEHGRQGHGRGSEGGCRVRGQDTCREDSVWQVGSPPPGVCGRAVDLQGRRGGGGGGGDWQI